MAWHRLGCAILTRALRDASDGNGHSAEAYGFLNSPGAHYLVELLEFDPTWLKTAAERLPPPIQPELPYS